MVESAVTGRGPKARKSGSAAGPPAPRRDLTEDFAPRRTSLSPPGEVIRNEEEYVGPRRFTGLRFRLRGGVPRSVVGRSLAGVAALIALGVTIAGLWELRTLLLTNPRLILESSSGIQISGNSHLTRAQLLSVFGEDVDRNVLTVSLSERRAELEQLPWVEHATVMRLLPNRFRVAITERKPIAFVRQGSTIGLVDASGVLLDMASDGDMQPETHYSFPVVTGVTAQEPLSVRAARMKLYARFMAELGDHSLRLSEVDLSNPEDIKALIADSGAGILVHFGDTNFLGRYELYEKNLPGWKKDFPRLASADMRYERQVVLEMVPGSTVPVHAAAPVLQPDKASPLKAAVKPAARHSLAASRKPVSQSAPRTEHLQNAFDVHAKKGDTSAKTSAQAGPR